MHKFLAEHKKKYAPELLFFGQLPGARRVAEPSPSEYLPGTPGVNKHMVVMEYIEGSLIESIVSRKERIPENVLAQIEEVLEVLHRKGYVFADLRPPNVILTKDGNIKFIDFNWSGSYDMRNQDCMPNRIKELVKEDESQDIAPLYPKTKSLFTYYPWDIIKAFRVEDLSVITPLNDWNMYERLFKNPKYESEE